MADHKLGKRQEQIYRFICDYCDEHGYPPSVRDIGAAVGLASPSTVHMHLKVLEEAGLIARDPNRPRAICLVDRPAPEATNIVSITQDLDANLINLPLVGRVAAGTPILAEQNVEE
ncbi:MAG: ArsR family transcriptional regulator, partial [Atopobiaceae bacterium]|nr:ArsR family transcriptional regulator [Atopobiaceae bacterium]